jgi:hypothetical protein
MPTDNRTEGRANVFLAATLCDVRGSTPVRIRNLSTRGALIDAPTLPAIGSAVRLARGSLIATGQVTWHGASQAGMNFDDSIDVSAWVKRVGHGDQEQLDQLVAAIRRSEPVPQELELESPQSLQEISAALDQVCERLASLPDVPLELGDELVKLDTLAQLLRGLAARTD